MRLLVIGHDKGRAGALCSALARSRGGYETVQVAGCGTAIRRIEAGETFDAAVLDAGPAGIEGLVGVARLCDRFPDLVVVALTSDPAPTAALDAIRLGAQDALPRSEATPRVLDRVLRCALARHHREAKLRGAALRDDLTGLLNRRGTRQALASAVDLANGRPSVGCAFLTLDLDDFKQVNDRRGHPAGDELLVLCARRIEGCVRSHDHVGRLGGDEFAVILQRVDYADMVRSVVDKLLGVFSEPFELSSGRVRVSASIGASTCPGDAASARRLVDCSDRALYAAKRRGKNRYVAYRDLAASRSGTLVWLPQGAAAS